MFTGVNKMCSQTPAPPWTSTHPPPCHRIPSAPHLPHLPPLHFSCLSSPFISPCVRRDGRSSFVSVTGEGKRGSGLHLSFAFCYHFSHLYPPHPTSAPLTHPPLPPFFAFDIQGLVWKGVSEKARAELTHNDELLTLQLGEPRAVSCCMP